MSQQSDRSKHATAEVPATHLEETCRGYRKLNHFGAVCRSTEVKRETVHDIEQ